MVTLVLGCFPFKHIGKMGGNLNFYYNKYCINVKLALITQYPKQWTPRTDNHVSQQWHYLNFFKLQSFFLTLIVNSCKKLNIVCHFIQIFEEAQQKRTVGNHVLQQQLRSRLFTISFPESKWSLFGALCVYYIFSHIVITLSNNVMFSSYHAGLICTSKL